MSLNESFCPRLSNDLYKNGLNVNESNEIPIVGNTCEAISSTGESPDNVNAIVPRAWTNIAAIINVLFENLSPIKPPIPDTINDIGASNDITKDINGNP